jgi:hypothetical protein
MVIKAKLEPLTASRSEASIIHFGGVGNIGGDSNITGF